MRWLALGLSLCAGPLWANGAEEFVTLKGHGGPIMALATDAQGRVASGSFDNALGLWSGTAPLWLEGHDAAVTAVTFGPAGEVFSGGDDFAVIRWQGGRAEVLGHHKGKIRALDVSDDAAWLASASWDGTLGLWPLKDGEAQSIMLNAGANDVVFGPDNSLYVATVSGELRHYESPTSSPRVLVTQGFGINRLLLSPEGWLAYGAVDGATRVIDATSGAEIADITLDRRPILALAHHADSHQLAVGDGQGYIMMLDSADWRISRDFHALREGPVWALAFSPDGSRIWAGGIHDVVYGWPVALLDQFDPAGTGARSFLADPETMSNGERQFMRKCSICHALTEGGTRKAGPHLAGLFGRPAGTVTGYRYSATLARAEIIWEEETIDALFDLGPDHYIPGSRMPMQRITAPADRRDLIDYLKTATTLTKDN